MDPVRRHFTLWALLGVLLVESASRLYLTFQDRHELRAWEATDTGAVPGFGVKKNFSQIWTRDEFSVSLRTNNIGLREDRDFHGEAVDIGFFGDSYTFGHGVESEERFSDRLRRFFPEKNILSFAYLDGWATPHYYLFLKKYPELAPKIAVVGLCLDNDLTHDIRETELRLDAKGDLASARALTVRVEPRGFAVAEDINPLTLLLKKTWTGEFLLRECRRLLDPLGLSVIEPGLGYNRPPAELDHGRLDSTSRAALSYLLKMKKLLDAQNKRLIVFIIPKAFYAGGYLSDYDFSFSPRFHASSYPVRAVILRLPWRIIRRFLPSYLDTATATDIRKNLYLPKAVMSWCLRNGVECVDPAARFQEREREATRLYFAHDPHWNPAGHALAAEILADYLKKTQKIRRF